MDRYPPAAHLSPPRGSASTLQRSVGRNQQTRLEQRCTTNTFLTRSSRPTPAICETIMISFAVEHGERAVLVEVSLERSGSSHVEGHAVEPATQHFGVPQLYGDDVQPF